MVGLTDHYERAKVKIADAEVTHKACAATKTAGKAVAEGCGFAAHLFGKLLAPIRKQWDEYKSIDNSD